MVEEEAGKIIITETREALKAKERFVAYVRLFKEADRDKLEDIINYGLSLRGNDLDLIETEKTSRPFLPEEERLWKAISKVIPCEPIPRVKYILHIRSLEYNYDVEDVRYAIAEALEDEGLLPELKSTSCVTVRKVRLFPFERPKRKIIPITRKMFEKMLQGLREKKSCGRNKNVLPIRREAINGKRRWILQM